MCSERQRSGQRLWAIRCARMVSAAGRGYSCREAERELRSLCSSAGHLRRHASHLHFDLHVADVSEQEAEAARLISLGARRVHWEYPQDPDFIVLEDPEGKRLCIVDLSHEYD